MINRIKSLIKYVLWLVFVLLAKIKIKGSNSVLVWNTRVKNYGKDNVINMGGALNL